MVIFVNKLYEDTVEFNRSKIPQLSKTIAIFVVTDNYSR